MKKSNPYLIGLASFLLTVLAIGPQTTEAAANPSPQAAVAIA